MLLQTNSYVVPKDKRSEHARLVRRFRQTLARLGCDHFEAYEQTGANWGGESTGRFVQIMRFRDRRHQQQVQQAERTDPAAQALIREFCDLINFPYQQQQGLFAVGFYTSVLPTASPRAGVGQGQESSPAPPAEPEPNPPPSPPATMSALSATAPAHPHPPEPPAESGLEALEGMAVEDLPDDAQSNATANGGGSARNGEWFVEAALEAGDQDGSGGTGQHTKAPLRFDEPVRPPEEDRLPR